MHYRYDTNKSAPWLTFIDPWNKRNEYVPITCKGQCFAWTAASYMNMNTCDTAYTCIELNDALNIGYQWFESVQALANTGGKHNYTLVNPLQAI